MHRYVHVLVRSCVFTYMSLGQPPFRSMKGNSVSLLLLPDSCISAYTLLFTFQPKQVHQVLTQKLSSAM